MGSKKLCQNSPSQVPSFAHGEISLLAERHLCTTSRLLKQQIDQHLQLHLGARLHHARSRLSALFPRRSVGRLCGTEQQAPGIIGARQPLPIAPTHWKRKNAREPVWMKRNWLKVDFKAESDSRAGPGWILDTRNT